MGSSFIHGRYADIRIIGMEFLMLKNQWSSEADMIIQPADDEEVLEIKRR
jgi:hypothetical protein